MHTLEEDKGSNPDLPWRVGYRAPGIWRTIKRFKTQEEAEDYVWRLNGAVVVA